MFRVIAVFTIILFNLLIENVWAITCVNVPASQYSCAQDLNGGWALAKQNNSGDVDQLKYREIKKQLGKKLKSLKRKFRSTSNPTTKAKISATIRKKHDIRDAYKYCENLNLGNNELLPGEAQIINYTFTATMRNPSTGVVEPTSNVVMNKVRTALRLWESVTDAKIKLVEAGFKDINGLSAVDLIGDKTLHIILNTQVSSEFGHYTTYFNCGSTYSTGIVVLDPRNPDDLLLPHIIQQTGVALTARWSVSPGAVMSNCTVINPSNRFEFHGFSEADRAVLVQRFNPAAIFTISGKISGPTRPAWIYAVDKTNGHLYSTMAAESGEGSYTIPILKPGNYHVIATSMFSDGTTSWYRDNGNGVNDPLNASVVSVSDINRKVVNINFSMNTTPPPFSLLGSAAANGAVASLAPQQLANLLPNFAVPGQTISFYLRGDSYAGKVQSIVAYGTSPDYHVVSFDPATGLIVIYIDPNAEGGSRLLLAKSPSGIRVAGDVGLHISSLPSYINTTISNQLLGNFNFDSLNNDYWKN